MYTKGKRHIIVQVTTLPLTATIHIGICIEYFTMKYDRPEIQRWWNQNIQTQILNIWVYVFVVF